jgi:glycosyltransferase involved in cell wall biosynthesis
VISPQFSIITPSFRGSDWLKLCIASVADQAVPLEHIVQDSCSDDGTLDWLSSDPRVTAYVEKDKGMYDAVNRGLRRTRGDILAYINCDEQYLPGALHAVSDYFQKHPETEILFTDTVLIGQDGQFLCYRKSNLPSRAYTQAAGFLSTLTCATFFRRSVIDQHQLFFNDTLRDLGDADWILRALQKRIRMSCFSHYTSVFTQTGTNMNLLPNARRERLEFMSAAPMIFKLLKPFLVVQHRYRRALSGCYRQRPFSYAVFTRSNPKERTVVHVEKPSYRWRTEA